MTNVDCATFVRCADFNPHEREARDLVAEVGKFTPFYFNPHEREARDQGLRFNVREVKSF